MAKLSGKNKPKDKVTSAIEQKQSLRSSDDKLFRISFKHLDTSQKFGSGFRDWQKAGLLSKAMEVLQGYCHSSLESQFNDKFTVYGDFPSNDKTMFTHPAHVPEDANWARIHVNGKAILVGHVVQETFHIVFLDKSHKFYLTKRARGEK